MSIQDIETSLDELRDLNHEEIANTCKHVTYRELENAYGRMQESNAAQLLSLICSMQLNPENHRTPYTPKLLSQNKRTLIPDDFSEGSLRVLSDFSQEVTIPELKARISDVLWVRRFGGVESAYIAIEAYLESAQLLIEKDEVWIYPIERIERALRLSCNFRRDNQRPDLYNSLSDFVMSEINDNKSKEQPFYALRLLELAYECGMGENEWILETANEIAEQCAQLNNTRTAIGAWEFALNPCRQLRDKGREQEIWRKIATVHIQDSEVPHSCLFSASSLLKAIDALSNIPNTREERLELYETMRDYQRESLHQMGEFATSGIDISDLVKYAQDGIQGRDWFDMLFRLGVVVERPTNISNLRNEVIEQQQGCITNLLGTTHIDHDGIPVATIPSWAVNDDNSNDTILWSNMMKNIKIHHQLAVQAQIRPALDTIMIQYNISENTLSHLFKNHPFIPQGHDQFYVKGIGYGLSGDFLSACHILIPQIENSLRYIARNRGEEPTTLHGDGSQERSGLKHLLDHPLILDSLGEDIVVNLQAILLDKVYGDLRNQMSHGYAPSVHFYGEASIYLWWLVLHILMVPYAKAWNESYGEGSVTRD